MEQAINDTIAADAQRYRAFRWVMCATDAQREVAEQLLKPLVEGTDEATPALLDAVMDKLADHMATLV